MENSEQPAFSCITAEDVGGKENMGLSKLEYTCIINGIPETGDEQLDSIIRKAELKRLATMAMQGILANQEYNNLTIDEVINLALNNITWLFKKLNKQCTSECISWGIIELIFVIWIYIFITLF